jgi:DNA-binding IclR family transcriptional regulator
VKVTQNEVLDAINAALANKPADERQFTVPELARESGKPTEWIRRGCHALVETGTIEPCKFSKRTYWGWQVVSGFQLVSSQNGKSRAQSGKKKR